MIRHFGLDRQYANLKDELLAASHEALKDGVWVNGYFTARFENWLQLKTKCEYAITVHSGTQALEIIARYLHEVTLSDADCNPHVRIPNLTYPATLNAFVNLSNANTQYGYDIEIVDTDKNGIMLPSQNTMIHGYNCYVGLYGAPTPDKLTSVDIVDGAQHWLIADGNVGAAMAISFDPTKNLPSSGNGGAIVTNDEDLYQYAISFRNNGKDSTFYGPKPHDMYGSNSKMSEQDCAHLLVRSHYIDGWQQRRETIRYYYLDQFRDLPIRCLSREFEEHADQKFVIEYTHRDTLHQYLLNSGIESKIHYEKTLSELGITKLYKRLDFLSASTMLSRRVISLPIYPELTDTEIEYIAWKIKKFFDK